MDTKTRSKIWRRDNKQRSKEYSRIKNLERFGLTSDKYDELVKLQGEVCASCLCPETVFDTRAGELRKLTVDHCHKSNEVRGLLCMKCNTALGLLQEDIVKIKRLLFYLYNHQTKQNIDPDLEY